VGIRDFRFFDAKKDYVQIPKHMFNVPLSQVSIFNLLAYKKFEEIKHKIKAGITVWY
jgi:hypothetical protein